jgi:hypothetical protein
MPRKTQVAYCLSSVAFLAVAIAPSQVWPSPVVSDPGQKRVNPHDFLIRGTVFTNQAYAFPGVQLKVRRSDEKKFRWETETNSRGEFAVRVPPGSDYELVVHAKGFVDQTHHVDAKTNLVDDNLVFRMELQGGNK